MLRSTWARDELRRTERKTNAKENLQTVVSEASREISDAEAEAYRHLAEHTVAITGDPVSEARIYRAWMSAVRQLDAGVDWNTILANAEARHDLDTVRALRDELAGWGMAKAGGNKDAQLQAAEQQGVAERAMDTVMSRIGRGDEQEAAQIRLAVVAEAELARAVLGPISKAAANGGSMSPADRLSLGYAQAVASHGVALYEGIDWSRVGTHKPALTPQMGPNHCWQTQPAVKAALS